ncbi:cytochrome P450 [Streptomyces boncukensis]|uniref:Cytochrome P450 n=1 Tax=Streptomyces boncukensis TaxID=2711219 RepID=A0A6G4WWU5_9ACTN|nr:cytochrome P450 [Streptomyces boncukensis]NGO69756.1 cytochrome P450 [Streptomyces boncukensis]
MTETATPGAEAPAYPSDRTCPYRLPEQYNSLRGEGDSLRRVTLYDGRQAWVVTRLETARTLLADPRLSSDRKRDEFPALSPRFRAAARDGSPSFLGMDPPEHGRHRRMAIKEFTVRRVRAMRPDIEDIVHGLLDDMVDAGPPADLVTRFSLPIPTLVICRLLGVPYADHDYFQDASMRFFQAQAEEGARAASRELDRYLGGLLDSARREPGEGLVGTLAAEYLEPGTATREELVATARLLLVAGHETTASMTSLSVITLLDHPEQLAALRADPSLMPGAVEELLRLLSIADAASGRYATDDIEIDGHVIRAGEGVLVTSSLANRDGAAFPEPDAFDIRRDARHHLAFGYGVHQCLGQNLARLELEVALTALFARLPDLRLAVPAEQLKLRPGNTIQGVNELPVTW